MRLPVAPWLGLMIASRGRARGGPGLAGTTVGIGLSLVPVIVVLLVADGMIEGITGRFLELDTYHARIVNLGGGRRQVDSLLESVRAVPQVVLAEAELRSLGLLFVDGARAGVQVRFVSADLLRRDLGLQRYLSVEGAFDLDARDRVVIGREVADTLGVEVGDSVALFVQGAGRVTVLRVSGVYATGYQQLDGAWVFMGARSAGAMGATGSRFVGVKVHDPFGGLDALFAELRPLLPPGARLNTWFELQQATYRSFRYTKVSLTLIMAVIALVAAVNVASALRMLLVERTADLAYLRAMGCSTDQIGMALLTVGLLSGAAGSLIGVALGLATAVNVNELLAALARVANALGMLVAGADASVRLLDRSFYLQEIPVRADLTQLLVTGAAATVAAAITAVRPALQAARLRPAETLRQR